MKAVLPLMILALLAPSAAEADRGGRGDRGERREMRMERGGHGPRDFQRQSPKHWRDDGPRRERRSRGRDDRFESARARGGRDRLPPGQAKRLERGKPLPPGQAKRFEPRGPDRPGRRGYSRGRIRPGDSRATRMEDYQRHRLRRPPPGYSYYYRGGNAYLVSDRTGMIYEVVPLGL